MCFFNGRPHSIVFAGVNQPASLKNDGTVWAWGMNLLGELGDGTTEGRPYPVQVKGFSIGGSTPAPASVLAADFDGDGRSDPIAVNTSAQWYFWHSNQSGLSHFFG